MAVRIGENGVNWTGCIVTRVEGWSGAPKGLTAEINVSIVLLTPGVLLEYLCNVANYSLRGVLFQRKFKHKVLSCLFSSSTHLCKEAG